MGNENVTTYGDISPRTAAYAKRRLLKRGQHLMTIERFGQVDPHQKNRTKSVKWRQYNSLPRASAPLAEGIPPVGHKPTHRDVTATLEQYGDAIKLTDVIVDTHEDPMLNESMDLCGEQAAETVEELRINVAKAGTTVFLAGGVTSRSAVNGPVTRSDLRKVYRFLKKYKAREISRIVKASPKISTEPVAPAYFALGHTDLDADIRSIAGFVPVEQYSNSDRALPGEIGKVEQFRFILTPMFEPWAAVGASGTTYLSNGAQPATSSNCDVYPLLIFAKNCFGIVPLQGHKAVKPMVINPGKPSKSDPLGQVGYVSWKTYQTAAILNQLWLARVECAATANPT